MERREVAKCTAHVRALTSDKGAEWISVSDMPGSPLSLSRFYKLAINSYDRRVVVTRQCDMLQDMNIAAVKGSKNEAKMIQITSAWGSQHYKLKRAKAKVC